MPGLTVTARERVLDTGPNGAGNSTLLDALPGVLTPEEGTVERCRPGIDAGKAGLARGRELGGGQRGGGGGGGKYLWINQEGSCQALAVLQPAVGASPATDWRWSRQRG